MIYTPSFSSSDSLSCVGERIGLVVFRLIFVVEWVLSLLLVSLFVLGLHFDFVSLKVSDFLVGDLGECGGDLDKLSSFLVSTLLVLLTSSFSSPGGGFLK